MPFPDLSFLQGETELEKQAKMEEANWRLIHGIEEGEPPAAAVTNLKEGGTVTRVDTEGPLKGFKISIEGLSEAEEKAWEQDRLKMLAEHQALLDAERAKAPALGAALASAERKVSYLEMLLQQESKSKQEAIDLVVPHPE